MENLADAISRLRSSAALTTRLQQEEALHAKLTSEAEGLRRDQQPKVLPHPKVIENLLSNLLGLLERDPDRARTILKRLMPPVVLTPHDGDGWKISGGFDLEATLDEGSAVHEVGGTPYPDYRNGGMWVPVEVVIGAPSEIASYFGAL